MRFTKFSSFVLWLCIISTVFEDKVEGKRNNRRWGDRGNKRNGRDECERSRGRRSRGSLGSQQLCGRFWPSFLINLQTKGGLGGLTKFLDHHSPAHRQSFKRPKPAEEPYSGQLIRLVNHHTYHNWGVLNVYRAGTWGHVCADEWDIRDATVACRMLGFPGALSANVSSDLKVEERVAGRIVMSEVRCSGTESSLRNCHYSRSKSCRSQSAATVECAQSPVCPEEWYPGFGKCYRLFGKARNLKLAAAVCGFEGGSLVNINSKEENHFLSNFVSNLAPDVNQWHTGSMRWNKKWNWYKLEEKTDSGLPRDFSSRDIRRISRYVTVKTPITEEMWFPGWPSHGNKYEEPSNHGRKECLTLSNLYRDPYSRYRKLDYFFWKADWCHKWRGIHFICQIELGKTVTDKDCYERDGTDYRGETAVTKMGSTCLSWANSQVVNASTHPNRGLGSHNYCRNPDGANKPWCWVDHERLMIGFCEIPTCSTTLEPTIPTPAPPEETKCPNNEFFCPQQEICIPGTFKCDKENDCLNGEDEKGCNYTLSQFSATPNTGLFVDLSTLGDGLALRPDTDFVIWHRPTNEMCAKTCVATTSFVCRSFVYTSSNHTCLILRYNSLHGKLFAASGTTFYELDSQRNCTGKFQCINKFCVDLNKTCDGNDDCKDMSDEMSCHGATEKPEVSVRLVGGDEHSGTVEMTYMGSTGVICDDQWSIEDATVICRMLGYREAENFFAVNYFNYPVNKVEFLLDEVKCGGNETSIIDCPAAPFKTHDCRAFEVAGVECQLSKVCEIEQFRCPDEMCVKARHVCDGEKHCKDGSDESNCGNHTVQLMDGSTPWEGRVQVTRGGLTGTICDDQWDDHDATVVCRSLGMSYGGVAISNAAFGQGSGPVWLDNVQCTGLEKALHQCKHKGWGQHDCDHSEDAGVRCFTTPRTTAPTYARTTTSFTTTPELVVTSTPTPTPTMSTITTTLTTESENGSHAMLQLVGGQGEHMGNIALSIAGQSYRVCDDYWDDAAATVVCRMLGYNRGGIATTRSYFGSGNFEIILDDVKCLGTETSLEQCFKITGTKKHDCQNNEFAGAICIRNIQPTERPEPTVSPFASFGTCGRRPYDTQDLFSRRRRSLVKISSSEQTKQTNSAQSNRKRKVEAKPINSKIVGGNLVPHGKHPWQVGIRLARGLLANGSFSDYHHCGGTILSEHWVLSAAHCFTNKRKTQVRIVVGDHNNEMLEHGEQKFHVEEMVLHKNFSVYDYDIALLKVKKINGRGIVFNKFVQPACLPTATTPYVEGTMCEISGWGQTELEGSSRYPQVLKAIDVPLLDRATCKYLYNGTKAGIFSERMTCAGYLAGGKDTCQGDSGGPLVCKVQGVYTLVGITSWGRGCAQPNAPGVYTLVQQFLPWIEENLREHSSSVAEATLPPRPRTG